jgi:GNAT superfamily N-acetyltransferase
VNTIATTVRIADLSDPRDAAAVLEMTRCYAKDPMGGGQDLEPSVCATLVEEMRSHAGIVCFLAFHDGDSIGIANCIVSFSTFRARPILNVHDLFVSANHRGKGVSRALLESAESYAQERGFAAITLEVLEINERARKVYNAFGFSDAMPEPGSSKYFCRKVLE